MDFASFGFIFRFLPIFMILYFVTPEKVKNLVLFLGSLIFYAWGDKNRLLMLLAANVLVYVTALLMGIYKNHLPRLILFMVGIIVNLFLILISHHSTWVIPAGTLIYCLQAISYLFEVYRERVQPQKDFVKLGVYISMFPQMNLGPVVCYRDMEEQLSHRKVDGENVKNGLIRFILGLFKKVVLANSICVFWNIISVANPEDLSTLTAWMGIASFGFKIYFDFSGYSDMSIGLGQIMGFSFKENFNYPFLATSIHDFWERWHISLNTWFRDYVYIPLGADGKGVLRKWMNLAVTWSLIGLWYGVAYHYCAWGLWFFLWMLVESGFWGKILEILPKSVARIYTWVVILLSLTFFAADSIGQAWDYFLVLFGIKGVGLVDSMALFSLKSQVILIAIALLSAMPWAHGVALRLRASETGLGMAIMRVTEKLFPALLLILTLAYMAKGY